MELVLEMTRNCTPFSNPCRDQVALNIARHDFALMPSCWAPPNFVPHQEMSLLHRFRRRAYPYVGRAVTAGEAIFLARRAGSVRAETAVSTVRMQSRGPREHFQIANDQAPWQ